MTRIDNATTQTLSQLVTSLNTNTTQELRSKGQDLYVKESQAFFTSVTSRTAHRQDAINLVRDGLAREYGVSTQDADRIMRNVFGGARPTQITSADANRLHQLGQVAAGIGGNQVQAFESARQLESLQGRGLSQAEAQWALPEVQRQIATGRSEQEVMQGVTTAVDLIQGRTPAATAKTALTAAGARDAFVDMLKTTMGQLPEFGPSTVAQKGQWNNIAVALGTFVPASKLAGMTPNQKASVLDALGARVNDAARRNHTPDCKAAYQMVIKFNKAMTLADFSPVSERTTVDRYLQRASQNATLQNARQNWATLTTDQRKSAVQTMIRLHSEEFGYTLPRQYLSFTDMGNPTVHGGLNNDGSKMEINTASTAFTNHFDEVFNTVTHESTHKYQHKLVEDLNSGAIQSGHPLYDQARIFAANNQAGVFEDVMVNTLGIDRPTAAQGYRQQPVEQHAFDIGDYAGQQAALLFA